MDAEYKTNSVIVYITVVFIYLVLLPICIIFLRVIWMKRTSLIMRKRYIYASMCDCAFLCAVLFIERPASLFMHLNRTRFGHTTAFIYLECVQQSLRMYFLQGFVYALLYRIWCIYFEFMYNDSLQRERWKIQINPNGCTPSEQWILDHRKDYGNTQWLRNRVFFIWITGSTIATILYFLAASYGFEWHSWSTILYMPPLIGTVVIWLKFPPFLDSIYIRYELKALIIAYVTAFVIKISIDVLIRLSPSMTKFAADIAWTGHTIYLCITGIFIQTQFVWNKVQNKRHFRNLLKVRPRWVRVKNDPVSPRVTDDPAPQLKHAPSSFSMSSGGNKIRLCDILQDSEIFNLFVGHLSHELSAECIFSFIEFGHFKAFVGSDKNVMEQIREKTVDGADANGLLLRNNLSQQLNVIPSLEHQQSQDSYDSFTLLDTDTIPLSYIVHHKHENEEDYMQRYKLIVKDLVAKYVANSADFCINIAYVNRSNVMKWVHAHCDNDKALQPDELNQMYTLFDKSRHEMYYLMKHTVSRFRESKAFKSLMSVREGKHEME